METLQQKRVVIQAVKTAILLLFILGFDFSYCQTIDGQYRSCDPSGQSCQSIEFKKNKFHSVYAGDFGPKVISKGYFIMLKDTLLLDRKSVV